jgi:hypothetical protein
MSDEIGSDNGGSVFNADEQGVGDYTSYMYSFPERCGHWTHSHVDEKRYPAVQAAIILEVGIRNSEGGEKSAVEQHSFCLKSYNHILRKMVASKLIPSELKEKFKRIDGTATANVLSGEGILTKYKLFKKHLMNSLIPLLPKTIHDIPSGKQLWDAFDDVCVELYKKKQKVSLAKKRKKENTTRPDAKDDEAMKAINDLTMTRLPDGWMYQKGYPEKLLLSMKIFYKSKVFHRSSGTADDGKPKRNRRQIRAEKSKQKLQEFADDRNSIYKDEVAKRQKVSRQKANSSAVEANSIHRMSVSMAQSTQSDMLKDHMAMFVQGKDFFSTLLQSEIATNLGEALLLQTEKNKSHPGPDSSGIVGPVELLDSNSEAGSEHNLDPTSDDDDDEPIADAEEILDVDEVANAPPYSAEDSHTHSDSD